MNDNEFSEPIELFFHEDRGDEMANIAFDVAAKIYNLEPTKYSTDKYFIGYMKLKDVEAQRGVRSQLFRQSTDLVRTLVHYKQNVLSEPREDKKVNIKDLKDALNVIDTFY